MPAKPMKSKPATNLWIWNWVGGGYNSARVVTREEALTNARSSEKTTTLRIDESTLHIGTQAELDGLDKMYAGLFD